jgi:hypothetical protein
MVLPRRRPRWHPGRTSSRTLPTRAYCFEQLDRRDVLTTITGSVFHDLDGDGVRAAEEMGLTGWQVTLRHVDSDVVLQQVTDNRQFRFAEVPAGRYRVSVDATDRWETTFPDEIAVDAAQAELQWDLGVRLIERLRGVDFHDMDINMDGYVDDSDIMQAWKSGKLLSDLPAKWEDGDWDRSGRFDTSDLANYAEAYSIHTGPGAVTELRSLEPDGPADVTFRYDGASGDVTLIAPDFELIGVQLRASTTLLDFKFLPAREFIFYQYDSSDQILYWAEFQELPTLHELELPELIAPGLAKSTLLNTLRIDGARAGGGGIGRVVLDCVNCPDVEQSIVTVQLYHDENLDGVQQNEYLVSVPPIRVSDRPSLIQPIGMRVNRPILLEYVFAATRNEPITITVEAPGGWRLSPLEQASIDVVPTDETMLVQVGLQEAQIRVTEIHYAPREFPRSEFLELTNFSDFGVSLIGVHIVGGVTFSFPDQVTSAIGPGQRIVLVNDIEIFRRAYPDPSIVIAGQYDGRLSNDGEDVSLRTWGNATIHYARFDDVWYPQTDERGMSLTLRNHSQRFASLATDWRPSANALGTPGRAEYVAGDANRDGVFDSSDLVLIFAAGKYEDNEPKNARWDDGDWDGDQEFTSADLVYAFQTGGYVS